MLAGGPVAEAVLADVRARVEVLVDRGVTPGLGTILVGDNLTLADVSNAVVVQFAVPAKLPIDDFKEIQRWFASLDQFPAWKATAPQIPPPSASRNANA